MPTVSMKENNKIKEKHSFAKINTNLLSSWNNLIIVKYNLIKIQGKLVHGGIKLCSENSKIEGVLIQYLVWLPNVFKPEHSPLIYVL